MVWVVAVVHRINFPELGKVHITLIKIRGVSPGNALKRPQRVEGLQL